MGLPVVLLLLMALILWRVRAKRETAQNTGENADNTHDFDGIFCVGSYLLSPKWQAVRAEYQVSAIRYISLPASKPRKRSFSIAG